MTRWSDHNDIPRATDYDSKWAAMQAAGERVHGEADLVSRLLESYGHDPGASVLDAGCGTGRVAIELKRRGLEVVGVDLDSAMLAEAKKKAPGLCWLHGDLCNLDLGQQFDLVLLAGNVMIFLAPDTEAAVLANLARHLKPKGLLLAGFQVGRLTLGDYDRYATSAGLALVDRWATWDQDPYRGGNYAVSLHQPKAAAV